MFNDVLCLPGSTAGLFAVQLDKLIQPAMKYTFILLF